MYLQQGRPRFTYNYFGSKYTTLEGKQTLPPGKSVPRYDFAYDGGGLGKGGTATLYADNVLRHSNQPPLGSTRQPKGWKSKLKFKRRLSQNR